ncbi:hypothetical protein WG66_013537 [Moniliophthora roreri]|nr:hypothetical protein WG66_013537 [Moniliophthora roreri]
MKLKSDASHWIACVARTIVPSSVVCLRWVWFEPITCALRAIHPSVSDIRWDFSGNTATKCVVNRSIDKSARDDFKDRKEEKNVEQSHNEVR